MSSRDQFIGTWRLLSYESHLPDGSIEYPFGPDVTGMLVYTEQGHMTGQVMRHNRSELPTGYRASGPSEAVLAAFDGYIAYCGTFEVDETAGVVIHKVEASLYPNWVGTEQRRNFRFDKNILTLSTPMKKRGIPIRNQLIWKSIQEMD